MTKTSTKTDGKSRDGVAQQGVQRMLLRREVMRIFGVSSRGTIDQMVEAKVLPPPVRIGLRNTAWPESEIIEVQRKMIAERDALAAEREAEKAEQPTS